MRPIASESSRKAQPRYRVMNFDLDTRGFPRLWHGGSVAKTFFWSQLSTALQDGERFLMRSASSLRGFADPELDAEFVQFCKQENHHRAQHKKFDGWNAANGINVAACRARFDSALEAATRDLTPMERLAFTVAGEHLTALLGEALLTRPDLLEGAHKSVKALWLWHAAEELEHRGTCFDIYQAAGGGYLMRVRMLSSVGWFFFSTSVVNMLALLREEGRLFGRDSVEAAMYLLGPRGLLLDFVGGLVAFLSPWFHPMETDREPLVSDWQREYADCIAPGSDEAVA